MGSPRQIDKLWFPRLSQSWDVYITCFWKKSDIKHHHNILAFHFILGNTPISPAPPGESIATSQADGLIDRDTRQLSRGEWGFLARGKMEKIPQGSSVRSDEHLLIGDLENLGMIVLRKIWKNHFCYWTSVWEKSSSLLGSLFNHHSEFQTISALPVKPFETNTQNPSSLWDVSHFDGNKKHLAISMAPSYTHLLGVPNIATDHFRFLILHQPAVWIGECRLANVTQSRPHMICPRLEV